MNRASDREVEIFEAALDLAEEDREAFLHQACAGDADLRSRVASLLDALSGAGEAGFLDHPTGGLTSTDPPPDDAGGSPEEQPGAVIDRYTLVRRLGQGGFGTVYMAEQHQPIRREVALKIIKLGMDTRRVIARFEAERQALARMDHPGIARVYDAGATRSGRPYFVMELVRGEPITTFCDRRRLTVPERLDLFRRVCAAVQHAHQKGIIHRDIKPSNVLVAEQDGQPVPKVIDFGIAKATQARETEKTVLTEARQWIGTPAYMSPEQASDRPDDVDTRCDVYSLGVLLYELLTGETPFDTTVLLSAGYGELQRIIREQTPPRPSARLSTLGKASSVAALRRTEPTRLGATVRGELDWIVMKALEKDRARRYDTPGALSADVLRFLRHEPIEASPPSAAYRARKFVRRHRVGLGIGAAFALVLAFGIAGTVAFAVRSTRAEKAAVAELSRANEIKQLLTEMLTSISPDVALGRDTTLLRSVLDATAARVRDSQVADDSVRSELEATLARAYTRIGMPSVALPFARSAYDTRLALSGEGDPLTIEARAVLAETLDESGDLPSAARLLEQNVALLTDHLGANHRSTLEARRSLAVLRMKADETSEQALSDARDLLAEHRRTFGNDDENTLALVHSISANLTDKGRVAEADELLVPAMQLMREKYGNHNPRFILMLNSHGVNLVMLGRFAEAEPAVREAIDLARRIFGERHPSLQTMMGNLSYLLLRQGRTEDGLVVARDVASLQANLLGPEHPSTLAANINLSALLASTKRYEEAAELLGNLLPLCQRVLGSEHAHALRAMNNLGGVLVELGRLGEARPLLESTYELKLRLQGRDHPDTLRTMMNLAALRDRMGEPENACELYETVYAARARDLLPTDPDRLRAGVNLARSLLDSGRAEDALRVIEVEEPGARQAWAGRPIDLAGVLIALGRARLENGQAADALGPLTEAFALGCSEDGQPGDLSLQAARLLVRAYSQLHEVDPSAGHDEAARRFRSILDP
ncbi:MAG: serine/threonine-protein kinase [Phycisphaerales bacterium]|nr:serine/threonine-protein kinase [Phycisphaerales bacterium]